jgi:murein DD-endopeptidase MepM/ murein hydrolase activator NlpD
MGPKAAFLFLLILNTSTQTTSGPQSRQADSFTPKTDWNDYAWPTAARRIVTSTFGEYRRAHFHAGIDISSGDAIRVRLPYQDQPGRVRENPLHPSR